MQTFDFIVVGSGLAGLSFALRAAEYGSVLVLTKAVSEAGSTARAQGGIASVMAPTDSMEKHVRDTLAAGCGLCRPGRVRTLVKRGPGCIRDLLHWGVQFSRSNDPQASGNGFHLAREGGHSNARILHHEDWTGREIQRALTAAVAQHPRIVLRENCMAIDLVSNRHLARPTGGDDQCAGLYVLDVGRQSVELILAAVTALCTGGMGQVYAHTTNDRVSTGDGTAMAFRAGVPVEDMEFVQFHPTGLFDPGRPTFLISEALRGHGGVLLAHDGRRIMAGVHPMEDLAPRDIVARAIDAEMKRSGHPCVYLDMTAFGPADLKKRFPNIYSQCAARGLKMERDRIPVVPSAHFQCGGVKVDARSRTRLRGLYACGETASTGVHGANRLASNSLLEAVVFSQLAVEDAVSRAPGRAVTHAYRPWDSSRVEPVREHSVFHSALETLRSTMWNYVGIVRTDNRLQRALDFIRLINHQTHRDYGAFNMEPGLIELRNSALTAELVVRSAASRRESRGLHYNADCPHSAPRPVHTILDPALHPLEGSFAAPVGNG